MGMTLKPNIRKLLLKLIYASTLMVSVILITDITVVDIPNIQNRSDIVITPLQFWVCIYFLCDFVLMVLLSDNKVKFMKHYGILFFLSIPYINILNHFDITLTPHAFYLLKFLPMIRGIVALALLVQLLINNKVTGLFVSYLSLFVSIAYLQTLIFFLFEVSINPQVKNYGDVVWWASMTVTTLGSEILPVTTVGKVSTVILAVTGITIFPIFTIYLSTMVQTLNHKHPKPS